MKKRKTHLALKQTTRLKIRLKYWFEYLFRIKSPSREFAQILEGDEYSEKEFRKIYIRSVEEVALKKLKRGMEETTWKHC